MRNTTEKFFDHLVRKDMVESIFKSWAWVLATAAIFRVSVGALAAHHWYFGLITFFAFIVLSSLIIIYVALYVAIPLNKCIENPNALKELTWRNYLRHPIRSLFSIPFVFYLVATLGFFLFSNQLIRYLARAVLPRG